MCGIKSRLTNSKSLILKGNSVRHMISSSLPGALTVIETIEESVFHTEERRSKSNSPTASPPLTARKKGYVGKSHNRRFPVTRRISHSLRLIHRLLVSHVSLTGFGAPTATNTSPGMEMHGYKYRPQGPCGNLIIRDMTSGAASLPTRTETPRAGFLGGRETSTPIDLSI